MKWRIVCIGVLFFYLASGFGFLVAPENSAALASAAGPVAPDSVASGALALGHLSGPTTVPPTASSPAQADAQSPSLDRDYDGLTDDVEVGGWQNGAGTFVTDPLDPDSDDDGLTDGQEKLYDTDPLDGHSPGIYVEYSNDLKTSKYFPWERHGSRFIALGSAIVRRGATFYVGGPASATLQVEKSISSLTTLTPQQDACAARWRIDVPTWGTAGKYAITLEDGAWSKSLNLYVIFELPTDMSDADVAAYVYSDDPDNFRDEYAIYFRVTYDTDYSWEPWPPYHKARGFGWAFQADQYKAYVFEDHVIDAINGYTSRWNAANALGRELDRTLRFELESIRLNMWDTLHAQNQMAQCSTHAAALASFIRGAGLPTRPVVQDWDMYVRPTCGLDTSTEVWLSGDWRVMRAWRHDESYPGASIEGGILPLTNRGGWRYHDSAGDIIAVAGSNWVWDQMQTDWEPSWTTDYVFCNYDNQRILRWDWVHTQAVPYYWWSQEPVDVGDPGDGLSWPSSAPTPSVIVSTSGNGSATKNPDQSSYGYNDVVTLEAFPADGWYFGGWSGDLESTDNPDTVTIRDEDDVRVAATFLPNEYILDIDVDGEGSVTKNPDQAAYHYGDVVGLTAVPNPGWSFDHWSVDLSGTDPTETITIIGDASVTAHFTPAEYTFDPHTDGNGDVTKSPDKTTYRYGDVVTLHAYPDSGWSFERWSGDLESTANPDNVTIDENPSVTAWFVEEGGGGDGGAGDLVSFSAFTGVPALESEPVDSPMPTPTPAVASGSALASVSLDAETVPYLPTVLRDTPEKAVQLGQVVADYGVDLDGNGRFDQLVVEIEVYAAQPGRYSIGGLIDHPDPESASCACAGMPALASARTYPYLEPGWQTVQLVFDGTSISLARVDGPYEVNGLWISDLGLDVDPIDLATNMLDRKDPAYTTAAYTVSDFETLGAVFTGQYDEQGVDGDGDGRYESLAIDVELEISTPGTYTVIGELHDRQGQSISQATWTGSHSPALLQFDDIRGTAGPYTLKNLYLLNADDEIVDSISQAYTTRQVVEAAGKSHIADQVGSGEFGLQGILPGAYSDVGLDLDDDGLYDLLVIEVPVEVEEAGQHRVEGWLESEEGSLISWASSDPISLTVGVHSLSLEFSGPAIHAHNVDGPFTLMALKLLTGDGYEIVDEVDVAYTTSAYTRDQFESPPQPELPPDRVRLLVDDMEVGEGSWAADSPWALVTTRYHSPRHTWTDSPGGDYANSTDVSLSTAPLGLSGFGIPVLEFQTCYDLETNFDYGYVEVSTDGGATWTNAATYTGMTAGWSREMVELGATGGAETLQVRVRLDTDAGVTADGWYIDDVAIYLDSDLDDDGIPNDVEIGDDPNDPVDTDEDGVPDYLDEDSDGDGIPDAVETGDDPVNPVDTDEDGVYDYLDTDSDDDGIPDAVEAGDDPTRPTDSDGDGVPDYRDTDSDDDTIPDAVEHDQDQDISNGDDICTNLDVDQDGDGKFNCQDNDVDGDGIPNYLDTDSDDDGLLDSVEAGDSDPSTPPVHSDDDGLPDFVDLDSDEDGIPDADDSWPTDPRKHYFLPLIFRAT